MRGLRSFLLSIAILTFIVSSTAAPQRASAIDVAGIGDLLKGSLTQVQSLQELIAVLEGFYSDPSLTTELDLDGFLTDVLGQFETFATFNSKLGDYGACLEDPVNCICNFASFVCMRAPARAALSNGNDPLVALGDTMAAIKNYPGIGEDHPVIQQFLKFATAVSDAKTAAEDLKKAQNKAVKIKNQIKALKAKVKAGTASVAAVEKSKAKLAKTKAATLKAQQTIEVLSNIDPVGTELRKLKTELIALQSSL